MWTTKNPAELRRPAGRPAIREDHRIYGMEKEELIERVSNFLAFLQAQWIEQAEARIESEIHKIRERTCEYIDEMYFGQDQ